MTDLPDEVKPKVLNEEEKYLMYSPDVAMEHYKSDVYYRQRKGGTGWFHGRVSNAYRAHFDNIDWSK